MSWKTNTIIKQKKKKKKQINVVSIRLLVIKVIKPFLKRRERKKEKLCIWNLLNPALIMLLKHEIIWPDIRETTRKIVIQTWINIWSWIYFSGNSIFTFIFNFHFFKSQIQQLALDKSIFIWPREHIVHLQIVFKLQNYEFRKKIS